MFNPNIMKMSPRSDLCDVCKRLNCEILASQHTDLVKWEASVKELQAHVHLAKGQRDHYNETVSTITKVLC